MKVLVVDDNELVVRGLHTVMRFLGHESDSANGYNSAYQMAKTTKYDLIITDYQMPDGTGLNLIEDLIVLEQLEHTKYIIMSALPRLSLEIRGGLYNYVGFLQKPFTMSELRALFSLI
jgi:two-component system chemotaxis response regulator CheY